MRTLRRSQACKCNLLSDTPMIVDLAKWPLEARLTLRRWTTGTDLSFITTLARQLSDVEQSLFNAMSVAGAHPDEGKSLSLVGQPSNVVVAYDSLMHRGIIGASCEEWTILRGTWDSANHIYNAKITSQVLACRAVPPN